MGQGEIKQDLSWVLPLHRNAGLLGTRWRANFFVEWRVRDANGIEGWPMFGGVGTMEGQVGVGTWAVNRGKREKGEAAAHLQGRAPNAEELGIVQDCPLQRVVSWSVMETGARGTVCE